MLETENEKTCWILVKWQIKMQRMKNKGERLGIGHHEWRKARQIPRLTLGVLKPTGYGTQAGDLNSYAISSSIMQKKKLVDRGNAIDLLPLDSTKTFDTVSYTISPKQSFRLAWFEHWYMN